MEYRINELSFALAGEGWQDATVHQLSVATAGGHRLLVEITRAAPLFGERLVEHVDAELRAHGRRLRGFTLVGREAFETASVSGISASFRSVTADGGVHQEVAYLPLPRTLLTFLVTAPVAEAGACREVMVGAIESLRLGPGAER